MAYIDFEVGRWIQERREQLGWSRGKLAELLGIAASEVSDYERGLLRPDGQMLVRIAVLFQRPPSYFFQAPEGSSSC